MADSMMEAEKEAEESPFAIPVNDVGPDAIWRWLRGGWDDVKAAGWVAVAYGAIFTLGGFAITGGLALAGMPYLITPMIGGFLLIGPLLALGLYRISADAERGVHPRFIAALTAWRVNPYHIMTAGLVLMLFVMIWARLNVVAFALFFPYVAMTLGGFLNQILTLEGITFSLFVTALGAAFATVAFVSNVVSLPAMLDRRMDFFAAAVLSVRVVARNPRVMALWAAVIVVVTGVGLLTAFIGLCVTLPLIGCASWRAYRELVAPPPG
ncbi:MAG TPA: DUF2189 domain-containing protein [Azospirillaceae bacterium]|nr:DUF2189 domain-containing protein [Azospirillaceae bacterium]HRQ81275.1 DUF2189 domain-containing protein [Azospirillaceae bacterium]